MCLPPINSNSEEDFILIFNQLCGGNNSSPTSCTNDTSVINIILVNHSAHVIKDHHFYEGIQKYDMFFAGWDDNDSLVVIESGNNDENRNGNENGN